MALSSEDRPPVLLTKIPSNYVDAVSALGRQEGSEKLDSLLVAKNYAEAEQACREILSAELSPDDRMGIQCRLGLALEGLNRIDEAYRHFREISNRSPREPMRTFCLIHLLNVWSRDEAARQDIQPALQALRDSESAVRWRAARALGKAGSREAVDALCVALVDPDENVRSHAAAALGQTGDTSSVPALVMALKDRSADVRGWAAKALGELGDRSVSERLIPLVSDPKPWVKWYACWALGKLGGPEAVEPLLAVLKSDDQKVREVAASALGEMKAMAAVPRLIEFLSIMPGEAAQALGMIGDPSAEPALLRCLDTEHVGDRCRVIQALGELKSSQAVPGLMRIIEDGSYREIGYAAEALAKIGDSTCVSVLNKLLKRMETDTGTEYDRLLLMKVAKAMNSFQVPEARRALQEALLSKNAMIRHAVLVVNRSNDK